MLPVRKGRPGRGLGARAAGPGLLASHRQGCLFLGPGGRAVDQAWAGRAARSVLGHLAASPISSAQTGVTAGHS